MFWEVVTMTSCNRQGDVAPCAPSSCRVPGIALSHIMLRREMRAQIESHSRDKSSRIRSWRARHARDVTMRRAGGMGAGHVMEVPRPAASIHRPCASPRRSISYFPRGSPPRLPSHAPAPKPSKSRPISCRHAHPPSPSSHHELSRKIRASPPIAICWAR